jgi:hypothetical protein
MTALIVAKNWVALPLYSFSGSAKVIPQKSGLNQWNGLGRARSPGESYIPVPKKVHYLSPGFFPDRKSNFDLELPNGQTVMAKICQTGGKALMSKPNSSLSYWLFQLVDGSIETYVQRFSDKRPYAYEDLLKLGFDCVLIHKSNVGEFKMTIGSVGGYETWANQLELS